MYTGSPASLQLGWEIEEERCVIYLVYIYGVCKLYKYS